MVPPLFSAPRRELLSLGAVTGATVWAGGRATCSPTGSGATFGRSCRKGLSPGDPYSLTRQRSVLLLSFIAIDYSIVGVLYAALPGMSIGLKVDPLYSLWLPRHQVMAWRRPKGKRSA